MAGIRGRDTKPELFLRKALHALGFRYRLHDRRLAGKPDIVLQRYRAVIFVHGCFWHGHSCHLFKMPRSRPEFWSVKISTNRLRDAASCTTLRNKGWRIAEVWECAMKGRERLDPKFLVSVISDWLRSDRSHLEVSGISRGR